MALINTYFNQSSNGAYYGCVQIENSKGERLKFEVCAMDRHDAEIMLLSTILEIKDDLMDAYAMFEKAGFSRCEKVFRIGGTTIIVAYV